MAVVTGSQPANHYIPAIQAATQSVSQSLLSCGKESHKSKEGMNEGVNKEEEAAAKGEWSIEEQEG